MICSPNRYLPPKTEADRKTRMLVWWNIADYNRLEGIHNSYYQYFQDKTVIYWRSNSKWNWMFIDD